jgi:N-formylglutamate amidohydrolase
MAAASVAEFSVLVDRPFSGALVPAKYYRREPRVQAVMIEINRRLYMDEQTGERLPNFGEIRQTVSEMLTVLARSSQRSGEDSAKRCSSKKGWREKRGERSQVVPGSCPR